MDKEQKLTLVTQWVDKFWACRSMDAAATERMHKASHHLLLAPFNRIPMLKDQNPRVPEPYTVRVMRQRAVALALPFTEAAFCMLGLGLLHASPATAIMYLAAIKHVNAATLGQIDVLTLTEGYLDNKILGAEDLNAMWDLQKLDSGTNLLDLMGPDDFLL